MIANCFFRRGWRNLNPLTHARFNRARWSLAIGLICCRNSSVAPTTGSVAERWYQTQMGYSRARPAVLGTLSYFGTGDGQVVARDQASGVLRWSTQIGPDQVNGANLVARNGVVVAPATFATAGLDAMTGQLLWQYQAPMDTTGVAPSAVRPGTVIDSRIDADDELVYIPAWGASVSALNLRTGSVRWVWEPGKLSGDSAQTGVFRSGSMSVRVSGDTVYATVWHFINKFGGSSEAWIVALQRQTGTEFWRLKLPYLGSGVLIEGTPQVYKNLVIVHTLSGRTYAIDRINPQIVWQHVAVAPALSTIAGAEVYGDAVYVDGGDRAIYALRASDGTVIWASPFPSATSRDMLVTDQRVVFTNGSTLFIVSRADGAQIAAVPQPHTSDPLFASAPAYSAGLIFVSVAAAVWCFALP
jgi:outer membrane protein assembly factor BamB